MHDLRLDIRRRLRRVAFRLSTSRSFSINAYAHAVRDEDHRLATADVAAGEKYGTMQLTKL